jgi:hypothetical protein
MRDALLPRAACVVTSCIQSRQSDSAELQGRYVRYVRGAHPSTSLSPSVAATRTISACSAAPAAVSSGVVLFRPATLAIETWLASMLRYSNLEEAEEEEVEEEEEALEGYENDAKPTVLR